MTEAYKSDDNISCRFCGPIGDSEHELTACQYECEPSLTLHSITPEFWNNGLVGGTDRRTTTAVCMPDFILEDGFAALSC